MKVLWKLSVIRPISPTHLCSAVGQRVPTHCITEARDSSGGLVWRAHADSGSDPTAHTKAPRTREALTPAQRTMLASNLALRCTPALTPAVKPHIPVAKPQMPAVKPIPAARPAAFCEAVDTRAPSVETIPVEAQAGPEFLVEDVLEENKDAPGPPGFSHLGRSQSGNQGSGGCP